MASEYIHYIKRQVVTRYPKDPLDPWFAELQAYENGIDTPIFHVTSSVSWPATVIKEGDTIWLVSKLDSPWGALPPSIDAKIIIKSINTTQNADGKSKTRYQASSESRWFPLTSATDFLAGLSILSKSGKSSKPYCAKKNNVGQAFQSIKQIESPTSINEWAAEIQAVDFDFISYRIADGTKAAFFLAHALMDKGRSVFWDRWSLPRRLAERRELVSDQTLDWFLIKQIGKSRIVWGVESSKYNEAGSYSAKEKAIAMKLNKYQPVDDKS